MKEAYRTTQNTKHLTRGKITHFSSYRFDKTVEYSGELMKSCVPRTRVDNESTVGDSLGLGRLSNGEKHEVQ